MTVNPYKLLRQKEIIQILDGDISFGELPYEDNSINDIFGLPSYVTISMPNLTTNKICDISTRFGFPMKIVENKSRWQYFADMLDNLIQNNRCSELLTFLFDKSQFVRQLSNFPSKTSDAHYNLIIEKILEGINNILHFSGHKLTISSNKFVVQPVKMELEPHVPSIKKIVERPYIADITKRALQEIEAGNFDSALTKARTLLEETFIYVIEKKNVEPQAKGNISALHKQVRDLYNMHTHKENDKRINELLSGLAKTISAISEMRNANSDAHGLGTTRYKIKNYHARLLVNATMTLSDFILSVAENNINTSSSH